MRALLLLMLAVDPDLLGPEGDVIMGPQLLQPAASGCTHSIECGIQSGDKSGNWWALKTDGTMLSGSALTMSAQGSPGVSPLTLNGSTQYFKSTNVTYPSGDFSIVTAFNMTGTPASNGYLAGKWDTGNIAAVVFVDTSAKINVAIDDGGGGIKVLTVSGASSTGTWLAACVTYTSASKALKIRTGGSNTTGSTTNTGVQQPNFPHSVGAGGAGGASTFFHGQSRGAFFTETPLSDAACDRIMAGVL